MINSQLRQCYAGMKPAQWGEALRFAAVAVAIRPQSPGAHHNLGMTLLELGKLNEAATEFRKAIFLKPGYVAAQYNLAIALQKLGKSDEALAAFRETVHFKSDEAMFYAALGQFLNEMGAVDEAITALKKAIRLKPDEAGFHNNLALSSVTQSTTTREPSPPSKRPSASNRTRPCSP